MKPRPRPTEAEVEAARGRKLRDVLAPRLRVLFCGINPGLYSAAIGHHFGRPGNRFWPTLWRSGFTSRLLSPYEDRELLRFGCGVTNLVPRATAGADELTRNELARGAGALAAKIRRYRPRSVAVLGLGAYRAAFDEPAAKVGLQQQELDGAQLWVLPNPSGRTAAYRPADFIRFFRLLQRSVRAAGG